MSSEPGAAAAIAVRVEPVGRRRAVFSRSVRKHCGEQSAKARGPRRSSRRRLETSSDLSPSCADANRVVVHVLCSSTRTINARERRCPTPVGIVRRSRRRRTLRVVHALITNDLNRRRTYCKTVLLLFTLAYTRTRIRDGPTFSTKKRARGRVKNAVVVFHRSAERPTERRRY